MWTAAFENHVQLDPIAQKLTQSLIFSSENIRRENVFGQACFLYPENQVSAYHIYIFSVILWMISMWNKHVFIIYAWIVHRWIACRELAQSSWNKHIGSICMRLQSFKKYLRQSLVFMWNIAIREKFNFYFSVVFGRY